MGTSHYMVLFVRTKVGLHILNVHLNCRGLETLRSSRLMTAFSSLPVRIGVSTTPVQLHVYTVSAAPQIISQ